jgi:hypothetical protein
MEHRDDLEHVLLSGLPEDERRETIESMTEATASKLARLRATDWRPIPPTGDLAQSKGRRSHG